MSNFIQSLLLVLETAENLPTLPEVVLQLQRALDDEMAGGADIATIINRDPALTTKLLRAANSASLSRSADPITSVPAAITRLGLREVRKICAVLAFVRTFGGRGTGLDHQQFWIHSATVGAVAQWLWLRDSANDTRRADEVYIAGLLHDVGLLILDQYFPEQCAALLGADGGRGEADGAAKEPLWVREERELGMDHGEVGGLLLGKWSLPAAVIDAVTGHHQGGAGGQHQAIVCCVSAAEHLVGARGYGLAAEGVAATPAEEELVRLGFDRAVHPGLLEGVDSLGQQMRKFLH